MKKLSIILFLILNAAFAFSQITYQYDNLNKLSELNYLDESSTVDEFDELSNRLSKMINSSQVTQCERTWKLSGSMTAVLDCNGKLTISTTKTEGEAMPDYKIGTSVVRTYPPWYDVRHEILSVVINDKITKIGNGAFAGDLTEGGYDFTSVLIPASIKSIGSAAFEFCTSLFSVEIPNQVTAIGENAFSNCTALTEVTVSWASPLSVPNNILANVNTSVAILHVPEGAKALYQAANVWKNFGKIDDGTPDPVLNISINSMNFEAEGGEQTFEIISNIDWTIVSDATWLTVYPTSGSNNADVTLTAEENYDEELRTATITVSGADVEPLTIIVTQKGVEIIPVVIIETEPVVENGNGVIAISLSIPTDATLTGSLEIQFPEGMILDEELTALVPELASDFSLIITLKENNTWLIEVVANDLRSAKSVEYRKIMYIAYKVEETITQGTYEATVTKLGFTLNDETAINEDELPVIINIVEDIITSIPNIMADTSVCIQYGRLSVQSPDVETVYVYSLSGILLHEFQKTTGLAEKNIDKSVSKILIVKGSTGWVKKVIYN